MKANIDIINEAYSADDELIVEEHSGAWKDHSDRVIEVVGREALEGMDAGHWITIVDGEIVEASEFHPFRIHVTDD